MGFGSFLNSITGVSDANQQNQRYAVGNAKLNFEHQKYFAQNAHQLEVEDLQKAGLNPALSASGSGASASGGGSFGGSGGSASGDPLEMINTIVGMKNNTSATNANNEKLREEAKLASAQALATIEMLPISKKEKEALIKFTNERARGITNSSSYSGNFGNKLIGGGGSYSNTTVR